MTIVKSIVIILTLANVGYFLWNHGVAQSREAPAAAAATLKLASEGSAPMPNSDDAGRAAPGDTAPGAAMPADPPSGDTDALLTKVMRCITVGPFRDVSEASRAASTLRGGGYDPRQRVVDGEVWAGVWVYMPIPSTPAASDQAIAKLKAAGIEDALVMPGPAEASVISLGLFSEQKRAQARVAQAQGLGFNPAIVDRKRTGNMYWIDVDLKPTDGLINPADLQGESGHISRLEVKACPAAAPT